MKSLSPLPTILSRIVKLSGKTAASKGAPSTVSYTHLDVYKRQAVLIVTLGSSWMLAGLLPSGKNRQPAASSSLLILIRAVASFSGIPIPVSVRIVRQITTVVHRRPPSLPCFALLTTYFSDASRTTQAKDTFSFFSITLHHGREALETENTSLHFIPRFRFQPRPLLQLQPRPGFVTRSPQSEAARKW